MALLTSLAIAGIAAYFSVIGMATIFAGAYIGTVVMMTALEVGKLVTAAYLHLAWQKLNYLKYYLLASVGVLMLITSLGIFGYLSKANIEVNLVGDGSDKTVIEQTGAFAVIETINGNGINAQTSSTNQSNIIRLQGMTLKSYNDQKKRTIFD
mgnify:CR=1 FL=1